MTKFIKTSKLVQRNGTRRYKDVYINITSINEISKSKDNKAILKLDYTDLDYYLIEDYDRFINRLKRMTNE